eukprot:gene25547-31224_t
MTTAAGLWQHPFVNIFKLCDIDHWKNVARDGEVQLMLDKTIGKKVYRIWGNIPAANHIQLPKSKGESLGLTGRFVYAQIKPTPSQFFMLHFDLLTADKATIRVSVSNLFRSKPIPKERGSSVQLPWEPTQSRWYVLVLDLQRILDEYCQPPEMFETLKAIQICSCITVRNLYTSDKHFTAQTLSREMALSASRDAPLAEFHWLPLEPRATAESTSQATRAPLGLHTQSNMMLTAPRDVQPAKEGPSHQPLPHPEISPPENPVHRYAVTRHTAPPLHTSMQIIEPQAPPEAKPPPARKASKVGRITEKDLENLICTQGAGVGLPAPPPSCIVPDPVMELHHMIGYSGEENGKLIWVPNS